MSLQIQADLAAAREELAKAQAENARLRKALKIVSKELGKGNIFLHDCVWLDGKLEPIDRMITTALAGGDKPVGKEPARGQAPFCATEGLSTGAGASRDDVVKAARTVIGAPAGPLPSELAEAIKVLDAKLADFDVGPERTE